MRGWRRKTFLAVVVAEVVVLLGMIARRIHLLRTGETILLKCQPLDPRSLFSGDYVVLNYSVSSFDKPELDRLLVDGEHFEKNQTVYVALEQEEQNEFWRAVAISANAGAVRDEGRVVMRGIVETTPPYRPLRIVYGVEHYFVPQYEGVTLEEAMSRVSVEIAVARSGESAIRRLFLDEEEVVFR